MKCLWGPLHKCCSPIPQRFVITLMVMSALAIQYINRLALNLAITEIVTITKKIGKSDECQINDTSTAEEVKPIRRFEEFDWDATDVNLILSIFYLGYVLSHIPGGVLADLYGPKRVLGYGVVTCACCNLVTPWAARAGVPVLVALRFTMGVFQGPLFPALSVFIARWALPHERGLMSAVMSAGITVGAISSNFVTGVLLTLLDRWDTLFIIYGVFTLFWYILWMIFSHDSPSTHPFIKEEERQKLHEALKSEVIDGKPSSVPYGAILTSIPVWAMIAGGMAHDWVFYVIVTLLPQYVSYILHYNIASNGMVNCLPYIASVCISLTSAKLAQWLWAKGMTKTCQSKLYMFIANILPCVFYIVATIGCNRMVPIVLFSLSLGMMGMVYSSVRVSNVDMSPNFSGLLMSLMNGSGSLCGFAVPMVFSLFTKDETRQGWRNAFIFSTIVVVLFTLIHTMFGSSELQPFNSVSASEETEERQEEPSAETNPG